VYLHDVRRRYKQGEATLTILDGANLALWEGQSVALVAPSGTGKSTLLHIAGLLEQADEGEVYVGGTATSGLSDVERTQIAAPTSVSSTSRTACCRNSRRLRT
jgi:lipoprotein-releasing system ATP-binding protein